MNTKQAKDFLIDQTVEQAALEGVPLSDIEKRMMYFTESDPASCDNPIELNDQFEGQYDTREYEAKISGLLCRASKRIKKEDPERARNWDKAIRILRKGDHYLLVMVDQSSESGVAWWLPILWGMGISVLVFIAIVVEAALEQKGLIPNWVFGWIASDRQTRRFHFLLIFCGGIGFWIVLKFAKMGVLGEIARTIFSSFASMFSSLRPRGRSGK